MPRPQRSSASIRDTDLAVLKISLGTLPIMPLGRSDRLRVGDPVLAIGNPLGLGQTVTQGIVSATGRAQLGVTTFENFIQTDAAINLGNSGGALIDATGKLVGLNSAIAGARRASRASASRFPSTSCAASSMRSCGTARWSAAGSASCRAT